MVGRKGGRFRFGFGFGGVKWQNGSIWLALTNADEPKFKHNTMILQIYLFFQVKYASIMFIIILQRDGMHGAVINIKV